MFFNRSAVILAIFPVYTSPFDGRYYKKAPPTKFASDSAAQTEERNLSKMLRNKLIAFALCAALGVLLAGCGDKVKDDVSSTVSRVESGVGETVSRVESGMEEAGSRVGSAVESMMEPDSSQDKEESSREEKESASPSPAPEPR